VKATIEPLEGNKVKLSVEVDEVEFDKAVDAAFRKIAREVRIPGFRPGKAPRKVLERRLGSDVGREQAMQDSLPEFYARALTDNDVDAIAAPEIDITAGKEDGPLAFDAVVEIRPEVQVPGYGSLRITLDRPQVPDEDVDAEIDRARQVQATLAEVDRPAIDGDVVTININGTLDGEPQEGLSADDYSYTVGSGALTPEVDEQLRGTKTGEVLAFAATHPDEDEQRELAFRILVKEVNERVLPEADDDWAAENTELDTIDELRRSIRDRVLNRRKGQAQIQLRQKAIEALAELVDDELPLALVEQETQRQLQDLALRLRAQGIDPEQWLAAQGDDTENLTSELRESATAAVRVDLALRAVADAEELECTDEDLEAEVASVAERAGEKPKRVREQFERGGHLPGIRSDVRKRKALEWLLDRVEIVDQDGQLIDRADLDISDISDEPATDDTPTDDDTETDAK
jgi:trigger factor